jgi:hypothetical protein
MLKQYLDEEPTFCVYYDANGNMTYQEKLLGGVKRHFDLLDWQNDSGDIDNEMQCCLVICGEYFYVLPDHSKSPSGVIAEEAST